MTSEEVPRDFLGFTLEGVFGATHLFYDISQAGEARRGLKWV